MNLMVMADERKVEKDVGDVRRVCDYHDVKRTETLVARRIARAVYIGAERMERVPLASHGVKKIERAETEMAGVRTMECDHHDVKRQMEKAGVKRIVKAVCIGAKRPGKV